MKKIKYFVWLCMVALLLPTLSACGNQSDDIYFLNFKPEIASVYHDIAKEYEKETGVRLRVVTAASGTYEQTLKSEIGKKEAPTIFVVNGPQGLISWKNYCADLKDTELYAHLTDKKLALTDGDTVYGIPGVVEGYGIIYNKALTDQYFALTNRQTEINSMEEVGDFRSLKTVVEDMTNHKSDLGINGVFASTSLKSGEDWRWQTHLANVVMHYEFLNGEVDLSDPNATKEVEFKYGDAFRNIFDLYLQNSTTDPKLLGSKQVADSMAEFALGQCVMVQNGNWAWSQIRDIPGNLVKEENIRFMPIYTGLEEDEAQGLCIGTENFLCINQQASPEAQKMAEDFLYWLYSSKTGKDFVLNRLDFIAPFDTFEANETPKDPLSAQVVSYMNNEDLLTIPWDFTVFPGQNFKSDFGAALLQYAQGSMEWEEVTRTFVERWKAEAAG